MTGDIHHACHVGGFRWRVVGVCGEAMGRLLLVGVWTEEPVPVPVWVSLMSSSGLGPRVRHWETFFPLLPQGLGLPPGLGYCH